MNNCNSHVAVIIAAGLSSRMGEFKPLLDIGGKPALFRLLDTIRQVDSIMRVIVVTGHGYESISAALREYDGAGEGHRVYTIYNKDYKEGMFSSVKAGIRAAGNNVLLFPADVPLVAAGTINGLIDAWERLYGSSPSVSAQGDSSYGAARSASAGPAPFAVPVFGGRNGHPLLIPRERFKEILAFEGDGGLKAVRGRYDADMIRYVTDDEGCVLDMDTPEDYEKLKTAARAGLSG